MYQVNRRCLVPKRLVLSLGLVGLANLVGCGGVYDSYVSGLVTLDGTPLPSGTVAYIPDQAGPASYGVILNDGSYVVNTGREEGLPTGAYSVTVVSREGSIEDPSGRGLPPKAGKMITPPWYSNKRSSPLKIAVEPGSNQINLELSSEPPPDWIPPKGGTRR